MTAKKTARDIVVDRILEAIESTQTLPWKQTWLCRKLPYNFSTKKPYRGINVLVLWAMTIANGHDSDRGFLTYRQASQLGAKVRKDEKGYPVLFAQNQKVEVVDSLGHPVIKNGEVVTKWQWITKYYTVFNVSQIDGLPEHSGPEATCLKANEIIESLDFKLDVGNPAYLPGQDKILCPPPSDFDTQDDYYASLFHELVHWTGAKHRLDRDMKGWFGSEKYSREELVAEIGASFLMAECGLVGAEESNASYVKHWLTFLKNDRQAIITAAAQAQKAVDYILGRSFTPASSNV